MMIPRNLVRLGFAVAGAALAAGQPRLVVDAPVYDFGTLTPDHPATHRFLLTNAGDAGLTLGEPWVQCACTTFKLDDHGLLPGASTWLTVTFNPTRERGQVERTLQVVSDDPIAPEQTVRYRAEVLNGVMRSAEDLFFQGLDGAGRARGSVTLRPEGMQPLRLLTRPVSPVPWLTVTTRAEDRDLQVAFTLDGRRLPPGRRAGTETVPVVFAAPVPTVVRIRVHWDRREAGSADAEPVAEGSAGPELSTPVAAVRP